MDDHLDFEYGDDTSVHDSCGASLHGEMFVIGGYYQKRQVCIINNCVVIFCKVDAPFLSLK